MKACNDGSNSLSVSSTTKSAKSTNSSWRTGRCARAPARVIYITMLSGRRANPPAGPKVGSATGGMGEVAGKIRQGSRDLMIFKPRVAVCNRNWINGLWLRKHFRQDKDRIQQANWS